MIFTSIGLLVLALILLIVGIAKSSLPPLIFSVIATVVAAGLAYASFMAYRRRTGAAAEMEPGIYAPPRPEAGTPGEYRPPRAAAEAPAPPTFVPVAVPANGGRHDGPPVEGYDDLTAAAIGDLVETMNLDELHELRRWELEHEARKTVLRAVDRRIESIIELRRRVQGTT